MDKLNAKNYTKPEQSRGEKAIQAFLDSVKELSALDRIEELTTRGLTSKSGYSTGTLYRYFKKIDDLFALIYVKKRHEVMGNLAKQISEHASDEDIHVLVQKIVNSVMGTISSSASKRVFIFFMRQFFRRAPEPEKFQVIGDLLLQPILDVQRRDLTNTIKVMETEELRLIIRCIQNAINCPIREGNDFGGTEAHKELVIDIATKLLKK